jgi:hypothetical protein
MASPLQCALLHAGANAFPVLRCCCCPANFLPNFIFFLFLFSVRCCGSCALNLAGVACGRLDAFYEIGFGGCWDVAAGGLWLSDSSSTQAGKQAGTHDPAWLGAW